jgi:hypothetical protein
MFQSLKIQGLIDELESIVNQMKKERLGLGNDALVSGMQQLGLTTRNKSKKRVTWAADCSKLGGFVGLCNSNCLQSETTHVRLPPVFPLPEPDAESDADPFAQAESFEIAYEIYIFEMGNLFPQLADVNNETILNFFSTMIRFLTRVLPNDNSEKSVFNNVVKIVSVLTYNQCMLFKSFAEMEMPLCIQTAKEKLQTVLSLCEDQKSSLQFLSGDLDVKSRTFVTVMTDFLGVLDHVLNGLLSRISNIDNM